MSMKNSIPDSLVRLTFSLLFILYHLVYLGQSAAPA
jgi:hypothetical protein